MVLQEVEVGRKVIYTPFIDCSDQLKEEGVVTSKNSRFVFVRYGKGVNSIATDPEDIEYL